METYLVAVECDVECRDLRKVKSRRKKRVVLWFTPLVESPSKKLPILINSNLLFPSPLTLISLKGQYGSSSTCVSLLYHYRHYRSRARTIRDCLRFEVEQNNLTHPHLLESIAPVVTLTRTRVSLDKKVS